MPPTLVVVQKLVNSEAFKIDPPWIVTQYGRFLTDTEKDTDGFLWYSVYIALRHPTTGKMRVISHSFREDE